MLTAQDHGGSPQDDWLVRYSYSPAGDLIAVRYRHGEVVREFEWQGHMLTAHRVPGGLEAHYTWDRHAPDGRVVGQRWTAHTRADGSVIEYRYDAAGRKIASVDPLGRETLIERDDHGQVIAQTAPDGTRWAIERDALGHPPA